MCFHKVTLKPKQCLQQEITSLKVSYQGDKVEEPVADDWYLAMGRLVPVTLQPDLMSTHNHIAT